MVDVPVLQAFTHDGRRYQRGQTITVTPLDAAILARQGLVSLTRHYVAAEPQKRRRYRRRDMTADQA